MSVMFELSETEPNMIITLDGKNGIMAESTAITDRHFGTVATNEFSWPRMHSSEIGYVAENYGSDGYSRHAGEFQQDTRLDVALDFVGATTIRYPGGTEAWQTFEWRANMQSPDGFGLTDYQKLRAVLEYCAEEGFSLSFTFPVRGFDDGAQGDRAAIQDFIRLQLLEPANELGVKIEEIKIGNEYHVAPAMSAEHYGHVASQLSYYIGTELDGFGFSKASTRPDIIIESGMIWRNGASDVAVDRDGDGIKEINGIRDTIDIINEFSQLEASYVDGIDIHAITLNVGYDELLGVSELKSSNSLLSLSERYSLAKSEWQNNATEDKGWGDLDFHTLAWSLPNGTFRGGSSLSNAGLVIEQFHLFSTERIESSVSWMAANFSPNSLTIPSVIGQNATQTKATAAGAIVGLLSDSIMGLRAVEMAEITSSVDIAARAFASSERAVVYVINRSDEEKSVQIDSRKLIADLGFDSSKVHLETRIVGSIGNGLDYQEGIEIRPVDLKNNSLSSANRHSFNLGEYEILEIEYTLKTDRIVGTSKSDILRASENGAKIFGQAAGDTIVGSAYRDFIYGGEGNDKVYGGGGSDHIFGGNGHSLLNGGNGNDNLVSSNWADRSIGGNGHDRLVAGGGNDWLSGGNGNDRALAGRGNDKVYGGTGEDFLNGGNGKDKIYGGLGNDQLIGEGGSDIVYGNFGDDMLRGDNGRDKLFGGDGLDTIYGGGFYDALYGGSGHDRLYGGSYSDKLFGGNGRDKLYGDAGHDRLYGGSYLDDIYGGTANDRLYGGTYRDNLFGGSGRDWLHGGDGGDKLFGGSGNDLLFGGNHHDGLHGGKGNDKISGGHGADWIEGGNGNDFLTGGTGADTFHFSRGSGYDRISDFNTQVDVLSFSTGSQRDLRFEEIDQGLRIEHQNGSVILEGLGMSFVDNLNFEFG